MRYSVDMIRLCVKVKQSDLDFLSRFSDSGLLTYYQSFDYKAFRDNFKIEETVFYSDLPFPEVEQNLINKVWLGCNHNSLSGKEVMYTKLFIEYNPNKTDLFFGVTKQIFDYYFRNNQNVFIVSCDVAIDLFDCSLDDLFFVKNHFRRVLDYRQNGGRTIYFGKKSTSGYTKIYDKAAEQNKDMLWTRVEFSFKIDLEILPVYCGKFDFDCSIPDLTFYNFSVLPADIDIKDRCCLKAVFDGYYMLDDFGRRYREKLKSIIKDLCTYHINKDSVYSDCKTCLSQYVHEIYFDNDYSQNVHFTE